MAKYIKFDLTANNPSPELLIPLDAITHCVTVSTTVTDVFLSINNAASTKWRITHTTPLVATAVLSAIQDAQKIRENAKVLEERQRIDSLVSVETMCFMLSSLVEKMHH